MKEDGKTRLLIVDDDKEILSVLSLYLEEDADFAIDTASTEKEALAKNSAAPYDIIVTDLKMPGMGGIELIKEIKREENILEFIIITAYASVDTAIEAVKLGAFDYVVKPFKFDELRIVIKNAKDKVDLKKTNEALLRKLQDIHREIDIYSKAKQKRRSPD
jgi:two-component system response regulator PilR (NtrC family)